MSLTCVNSLPMTSSCQISFSNKFGDILGIDVDNFFILVILEKDSKEYTIMVVFTMPASQIEFIKRYALEAKKLWLERQIAHEQLNSEFQARHHKFLNHAP